MKPNFISEEQFAEMVKGMKSRAKEGKKVIRPMTISLRDGSSIKFTESPIPDPMIGDGLSRPIYIDREKGGVVGTRCTVESKRGHAIKPPTVSAEKPTQIQAGSNPAPSPPLLSFTFSGQLCSGKNQIQILRRKGKMHKYPNKTFKNWRAKAKIDILAHGIPSTPVDVPVVLTCHYTPGDLRTRDITGQLDAIFHLLVHAKVLKDDGLVHEAHWYRLPMNRKAPQVTLNIQPLKEMP